MISNLFEEINKKTPKISKSQIKDFNFVGSDTPLQAKNEEFTIDTSKKYIRTLIMLFFVFLMFFAFVGRSYVLQIIKGQENLALSEDNRIRAFSIPAERGVIFDSKGKILVRNTPSFVLEMNTTLCRSRTSYDFTECKNQVDQLTELIDLEIDKNAVFEQIDAGRVTLVIANNLSKEQILPLEPNLKKYESISINSIPQRDYLFNESFSHLLGYVGFGETLYTSIEGKYGIEQSYDEILTGVDGSTLAQFNSAATDFTLLSEKKPESGKDIVLYVDSDLQNLAYELLKIKVESNSNTTGGAIVAQDPNTGGILALASYPSFDAQKLSTGISSKEYNELISDPRFPFFNRVVSGVYPPASTFKMIMASAILTEGLISPNYQITDPGFIQVGAYRFNNWKLDGHGLVDLLRAIQVSNDTYFYTFGGGYNNLRGLGIDKIAEWSKKFGFGKTLGIDISGEAVGFVPDGEYKDWYLGDTYITSIGQGDMLTTPLQVNAMSMYFANEGKIYKPKIVKEVEQTALEAEKFSETQVLTSNLVSKDHHQTVRQSMLIASQPGGTAYPVFNFADQHNEIKIAGKTGTAEFGAADSEITHAWYTAFAPYDEPAEIVLTVFLEGGGGGSGDAAPIARALMDLWFKDQSQDYLDLAAAANDKPSNVQETQVLGIQDVTQQYIAQILQKYQTQYDLELAKLLKENPLENIPEQEPITE